MLVDAIDIPQWLERDHVKPWRERLARDREIASRLGSSLRETERVREWWRAIPDRERGATPGQAIATVFRRLDWLSVVLGGFVGVGVCSAALAYDGSRPINVLIAFAVLVLIPFIFLLLSYCLPILRSAGLGGSINIGNLVLGVLKRKNATADAFFSAYRTNLSREKLIRWRAMLSSQQFGLSFSTAALLLLLIRVSFSDLAFGWSTTLDVKPHSIAALVETIAMPWAEIIPQAVPTPKLVAQSQFYRLQSHADALSPEMLTTWWRFLAMSIVTFGILPRVVSLLIALWGYRRAIRNLLVQHSEVSALLDRMNSPVVAAGATTHHRSREPVASMNTANDALATADLAIRWNGAGDGLVSTVQPLIEAGGDRSFAADLAAIKELATPLQVIHIYTKAWEPPMFDLHDYIVALRAHAGDSASIVIRPLGEDGAADERELGVWRKSLAQLQDPRVYVK